MATRRSVTAKDGAAAVAMLDAEKRAATPDTSAMRRCIGSAKFGIEAHEAPAADFPVQPSQKDGLGRMCKVHWNAYTNALRKASIARKAAEAEPAAEPTKKRTKRTPKGVTPEVGSQGDAG
jgi:hypothetical protein